MPIKAIPISDNIQITTHSPITFLSPVGTEELELSVFVVSSSLVSSLLGSFPVAEITTSSADTSFFPSASK